MNEKNLLVSRLFLLYRLVRPILPILSGLAAWIIARFSEATFIQSLAAAISIALSTVGASFYHFGGANWMYTRKSDRFKFKDPEVLRLIGLVIFSLSICIATFYLPKQCVLICVFNTLAIAAYSAKLSSHWATKNITMAIVCLTPVVIGWQAGTATHPITYWGIGIAFIAYLSREMIKDVKDINTNEGKRITLPMILGIDKVLQISGGLLFVATILSLAILQFTKNPFQIILVVATALMFLTTGIILLINKKAGRCETLIQASICLILLSLL